jgi:hypothetical protein
MTSKVKTHIFNLNSYKSVIVIPLCPLLISMGSSRISHLEISNNLIYGNTSSIAEIHVHKLNNVVGRRSIGASGKRVFGVK